MVQIFKKPQLVVVAGPNGAGKSTLTSQAYPELIENTVFINPDEIVKQVAHAHPEKSSSQQQIIAAREALKAYEMSFQQKISFSLETTLAGRTPLKTLLKAQSLGYHIRLVFVGIESPQHAIARVHERVQQGGHDVPIPDILRRYERSMQNLPKGIALANHVWVFDNSYEEHDLLLFIEKGYIRQIYQHQFPIWLNNRVIENAIQLGKQITFKN